MSSHDPAVSIEDIRYNWKAMAGMRDKLIHGFDTVDPSILWGTIQTDVPEALSTINLISGSIR